MAELCKHAQYVDIVLPTTFRTAGVVSDFRSHGVFSGGVSLAFCRLPKGGMTALYTSHMCRYLVY